jgi:hypothetical protein
MQFSRARTVMLASTFYTGAFEQPFQTSLAGLSAPWVLICVPYNQHLSFLLNPFTIAPTDTRANVLLMIRVEDFVRNELSAEKPIDVLVEALHLRVQEFLSVITRMLELRLTVVLVPSGRGAYNTSSVADALRIAEHKVLSELRAQQRHRLINWKEIEAGTTAKLFNPAADRLGHVPFTPEGIGYITTFLTERLDALPVSELSENTRHAHESDFSQFLEDLAVNLTAELITERHEKDLIDLLRKTTHFTNQPHQKWSPGQITQMNASHDRQCWAIEVADRHGRYGLSGAAAFEFDGELMRIPLLFLICPILGKQVEHVLLVWISHIAHRRGVERIEVPFVCGRDNDGMRKLLSRLETGHHTAEDGTMLFHLRVEGLLSKIEREIHSIPAVLSTLEKFQVVGVTA